MNTLLCSRTGLLSALAAVALAGVLGACSSSTTPDGAKVSPSDAAKVSPSATPTAASPMSLSSSLADGSTLTEPVAWSVDAGDSALDHVDFLIDNKVRWTEFNAPYVFNDDDGFLAPWLLSPGNHVFTARATAPDGKSAETVATVRIDAPPAAATGLRGTFVRTVTQQDLDRTASQPGYDAQAVPGGPWTAHLANGLLTFDDPWGSGGNEAFTATSGRLKMWGPANWLLPKDRQGGMCEHLPPTVFHWSRAGDQLIITGGGNCAGRDALFVGSWQKQP